MPLTLGLHLIQSSISGAVVEITLSAVRLRIKRLRDLPIDQWDLNYQLDFSQLLIYEEWLSIQSLT